MNDHSEADVLVEERTVHLGNAETVKSLVQMGVGKLGIRGGAEALFSGRFEYLLPSWKPEVSYEVAAGRGMLRVKQPSDLEPLSGDPEYTWDLAYNDAAPLDLALQLGAGNATLTLGGTALTQLDATIGSGALMADLSGEMSDLLGIAMTVGSGRTGVVMEGTYASLDHLRVSTASGVSELALGGSFPQLKQLKVNSASGRTSLGLTGAYPELERLALDSASGVIDLNLGEALQQDLEAAIHCVSGVITVVYPPEAGVSVRFMSLTGKMEAPGFSRREGRYVNDVYGKAPTALRLNVSTVSGKLNLQPAGL
jgi:hypothetical protein